MNKRTTIKFIDLFAGIGGIRLGFEQAAKELGISTECVFTSEIDQFACHTYKKNFPHDGHDPLNDVTKISAKKIEDFDVLLAGFPCQAFSIAGKRGGFEDTRGTLFYDVARILDQKRPDAFILENVKGLVNHKGGSTLATILNVLRNELGYKSTRFKVLNSKNFGVPQNRERIYIVGFADGGGNFSYPEEDAIETKILDIIEKQAVDTKYYLSKKYLDTLKNHRDRHESKGNGFGFEIRDMEGIANAIVVGGMGKERNLLEDPRIDMSNSISNSRGNEINNEFVRKMTPLEWERLQGLKDNWTEGVSDTQRYKQLGNSVAVPVIKQISTNLIKEMLNPVPFISTEYTQNDLFKS